MPLRSRPYVSLYLSSSRRQSSITSHRISRKLEQLTIANACRNCSNLPQQTDLLSQYQSLVTLGHIKYDEAQVRLIMQLRRLSESLDNYAPPVTESRSMQSQTGLIEKVTAEDSHRPWWAEVDQGESTESQGVKALIRIRSYAEELAELTTPKGLLVTGPPGCGKSFVVDLWLSSLSTPYKARKHYNELVLDIYRAVWVETQRRMGALHSDQKPWESRPPWTKSLGDRWRALVRFGTSPKFWTRSPAATAHLYLNDPSIGYVVAQRLILRHWLLVFDEVQLLDISSATLLADVLSWFWRMGGVMVGTSNKVPDDLYKDGVQRARLEPFVEALKIRCPVVSMQSSIDWRTVRGFDNSNRSWFGPGEENLFKKKMAAVSGGHQPASTSIRVFGRDLHVPWSSNGVCKYSFRELCEESLGPADYISLASNFHTVAITSIPSLDVTAKNQARRFISFIDALYEARCNVICSADCELESLFFPDAHSSAVDQSVDAIAAESVASVEDNFRPNISSYDSPHMAQERMVPASALALDNLTIFSGQEEQFAFKRAFSRLIEMTSKNYQREEQWKPLSTSLRKWEGPSSRDLPTDLCHPGETLASPTMSNACSSAAVVPVSDGPQPWQHRPEAPRFKEEHIWGARDDWSEDIQELDSTTDTRKRRRRDKIF